MTRRDDLRDRLLKLRQQLARVESRLKAIVEYVPDHSQPVTQRIRSFLKRYAGETFSPKELMEAVDGSEHAVRRALTRLVRAGLVVRATHASYGVDAPVSS